MPHIKWFWRYLFSIVLFALPTYSSVVYSQPPVADTGEIDGTVYRRESGRRLANVNVRLIETNQHTLTDEKGGFGFSNVPAGEYTLTVSASGYRTPEDEAVTVKPGQTTEVQLYLEGVEFLLEEIRVTSPRPPVTVGRQTVGALEVKRVSRHSVGCDPCTRCIAGNWRCERFYW